MRKGQEKSLIYEAALRQFAQGGYKKTTLESIADELNMTNANLYCYAKSKQALYHDSVAYAMTKWQNKVYNAVFKETDPVKKVSTLFDTAVLYLSEDEILTRILENDPDIFPMFPVVDPYEEINARSREMLAAAIQNGVNAGVFNDIDATNIARIFFAVYKTIIIEGYIRADDKGFIQVYEKMKSVILYGLIKRN